MGTPTATGVAEAPPVDAAATGSGLRIGFCTIDYFPSSTAGGAERQARLQAEELTRRGHDVTVICPRTGKNRSQTIGGVSVIRLPRITTRPFFRITHLISLVGHLLLHGRRYDIIHVHLANIQADLAVLIGKLIRRPVYVKVACGGSAGEVGRMRKISWLTRWYGLRRAARVQALSEEIADELMGIGTPAERIVQIPNGVDLGALTPASPAERHELRTALGLPDGPIVLYLGRFATYKGIDDLLEAWARVAHPTATLVLVGTAAVDKPVQTIPDGERGIMVRGWTNSAADYVRAADIFVHPTHADGMSNSLLEAMAAGVGIVATRHGATEGFLTDGRDGLLVEPQDPAALARALELLLEDPSLCRRLGEGAARTADEYAIARIVTRIESVYRSISGAPVAVSSAAP